MNLWIASGNADKAKELIYFSNKFFPNLHSITAREPKGVIESEDTFYGNAKLKARALAQELISEGHENFDVIGDDSGLSVDLLNGAPGIHSARYSGANSDPQKNLNKLLRELNSVTIELGKRTGRYHSALCLVRVLNGEIVEEIAAEGLREGLIGLEPKGTHGYAYDSVFLDPQTFLSYGEVSYEEKQKDSHRCRAFKKLRSLVENLQ